MYTCTCMMYNYTTPAYNYKLASTNTHNMCT